ncbi:DUF5786 family protein [Halopenitus persicus]|uniref:DUF5786 family protein n=1 Tax=Halopenitus persicus TaxID=1048396 RepID=UPI000BBACCAA|nr:DUF5786 family protein [Halopenitus persicus]
MGFGSYDESEQENANRDDEDDGSEAVNVHENDHDGSMSFESDASTDDLVGRLDEMKDDEGE